MIKGMFLIAMCAFFFSCNGESTVTEHFKRVETKELILTDQDGKTYQLTVDKAGNVKAIELKN